MPLLSSRPFLVIGLASAAAPGPRSDLVERWHAYKATDYSNLLADFTGPDGRINATATQLGIYASTCVYSPAYKPLEFGCKLMEAAGWTKSFGYAAAEDNSQDVDAVDLWTKGEGEACLLAFRGPDEKDFVLQEGDLNRPLKNTTTTKFYTIEGVAAHLGRGLEALLDQMRHHNGGMAALRAHCKGANFTTAGHSVGGASAALFATLANDPTDPLELSKKVTGLYTYGAVPVADHPLVNQAQNDGCFPGAAFYTMGPAGEVTDVNYTIVDAAVAIGFADGLRAPLQDVHALGLRPREEGGPEVQGVQATTICGAPAPAVVKLSKSVELFKMALDEHHYSSGLGMHNPAVYLESVQPKKEVLMAAGSSLAAASKLLA